MYGRKEKKWDVDVTLVSPAGSWKVGRVPRRRRQVVLSAADRPMREENAKSAPY